MARRRHVLDGGGARRWAGAHVGSGRRPARREHAPSAARAGDARRRRATRTRLPGRQEHHAGLARWPELQATTDFFAAPAPEDSDDNDNEDEDDLDGRADHDWRAACLAVIDRTTGARLTGEWLDQAHPYVTVRMPDATR
ncbi:hypothetical protein ACFQQB_59800 [Nonomuraea rubra]|uniref:hypothetical protein n=1 Tax=Nonomuraea rubra TaxID=46180 RepID=UPI0036088B6C